MDLGNVKIGLGVDSSQFTSGISKAVGDLTRLTSGISKAVGDLTRLAEGLKKTGLQGVEPLQRKIETFQRVLSKAPNTPALTTITAEFNKVAASADVVIQKISKLRETNLSQYNAAARGAKNLEELNHLSKALTDLTVQLTSAEEKKTDSLQKGNRVLENRQKLLDTIAKREKEIQAKKGTPEGEVARLASLGFSSAISFVPPPQLQILTAQQKINEAVGEMKKRVDDVTVAWRNAQAQQALYTKSLTPLNFLSEMSRATTGGLTLGGSSLGKSVQQEVMLGEVFGRSPNKSVISLMTQEVEKLTRSLSDIGLREGITPIIDKFTALGQRVKNLQIEILTLNKEIAAGTAKEATAEQAAAGRIAQQKLITGYGTGGFISAGVKDIQMGLTAAAGDIKQATYQNLRKETDDLIKSTKTLGTTQVETSIRSEQLRTAQGNVYEMIRTGKGDVKALQDEHTRLGTEIAANDKILNKFEESGKRAGMGIKSLIKWQIEWYLTQNLLFGVTGVIVQGIKNMVEFEQKLANLQAITNSTTADTQLMGKAARELGINSRLSALEIADGMTIIGQAGFNAKETIQTMTAAVALSTSTLSSMAITTDLITTGLRAFELDASDAAKVANVFAASTNYSKLTMDDLKTAFNYVAVIGKQAGLSLEEVNSTLGAVRDRGVQASTAATGFRGVLGSLIAPSERFAKEIKKAGLTLEEVNPLYNNWIDILRKFRDSSFDIESAFKGVDKRVAGFLVAAINSVDANEQLLKAITGTNAAFEMMRIQLGTTSSNLKIIGNNLGEIGLKISDMLLPPVYAVTLAFSALLKGLNNVSFGLGDATKQGLLLVSSVTILTGSITLLIAKVIPFVAGLLGMKAAAGGLFATIGAFLTGRWGIVLVAVITGIATAFGMSTYNANKAKQAMLDLNKEATLSIASLSGIRKELDKYKSGSKELASVVDRLITLYPELAGKADFFKGSVVALREEVDKLTESQKQLFLASVGTVFEQQEKVRKDLPIPRKKGLITPQEFNKGGMGLSNIFGAGKVEKEPTYPEVISSIGTLTKIQEGLVGKRKNVGKDAAAAVSIQKEIVDNQKLLNQYNDYLKSYNSTVSLVRKYEEANKGRDAYSTSILAGMGLSDLPPEVVTSVTEKPKAPKKGETEQETTARESREKSIIESNARFANKITSLKKEVEQQEIAALRAHGKDVEAIEAELKIKKQIRVEEEAKELAALDKDAQLKVRTEKSGFYGDPAHAKAEAEDRKRQVSAGYVKLNEADAKTAAEEILKIEEKKDQNLLTLRLKYEKEALALATKGRAELLAYNRHVQDVEFQDEQESTKAEIAALKEQGKYQIDSLRVRGKLIEAEVLQHNLNLKIIERERLNDIRKAEEEQADLIRPYQTTPGGVDASFSLDVNDMTAEGKAAYEASRGSRLKDSANKNAGIKTVEENLRTLEAMKKMRGKTPLEGLQVGLSNMSAKFGTFGDQIETFTETGLQSFTDGMAEAFTSFVDGTKSAGDAFKDFTKSFLQNVLKMINQMLAMQAVKQIVGLAASVVGSYANASAGYVNAGSGSMSAPSSLGEGTFAFATGGVIPSNIKSFRRFSSGGITSRPALAILGDNASQKELVIPSENIKENSASGYTRDKNQNQGVSILNVMDPSLVPQLVAANPELIVNIINADVIRRGVSYQNIKQISRR